MLKKISILMTHELNSNGKEKLIGRKKLEKASDLDLDEAMFLTSESYFLKIKPIEPNSKDK